MVKIISSVILLFLLMPINISFAQSQPASIKSYSGFLHQYNYGSKKPFWHALFSKFFPKQEEDVHDWQCFIDFKSPSAYSNQPVTDVPKELTYLIKFRNGTGLTHDDTIKEKKLFKKVLINIYADDDEEYTIDPGAQGSQIGLNDVHHIFDSYMIYLILGTKIDHIEVVSAVAKTQDMYVLDKFEIQNSH